MGCAYGRDRVSDEEAAIQAAEDALPITKKTTEEAVKKVQEISPSGYLTTAEFTRLSRELDLSKLTPQQNELFKQFQRPEGYSKRQILLLTLLLSQGPAEVKAKYVFGVYSESSHLPRTVAATLISDLVQLAVGRTTILVEMTDSIKAYIKELNEKTGKASESMLDLMMGKKAEASEVQFVEAFQASDTAKLLTCRGLRNFISGRTSEK